MNRISGGCRMKCKICYAESRYQFSEIVLSKHLCRYFYCAGCGFLQTEEPYWLDEAYQSAIAAADTGLVLRNISLSKKLAPLLYFMFGGEGRYLDFAGGYGMFTRLMRDIGFDYYWTDLYCQNLLARGFEISSAKLPFTAVTAFEVLEHVPDPMEFLAQALDRASTRTIIVSTELFEGAPPNQDWWYYTFATGQHISFYQRRTLEFLGAKLGLNLYSHGSLHMFTDKKIRPSIYRFLTYTRVSKLLSIIPQLVLTSKTVSDHVSIMKGRLQSTGGAPSSKALDEACR
ncbi:class I SAM-dependent methyltransferase [Edaphobacter aggregans]|uniref:class I SAM-dependent methyltransferase n=1 Tax=Edaphobacter aggregans TaxID=570835 RepID=UPI001B7FF854|nr:class I SAM-dependent methyltransferase [Edaphobacter aggregans]